MNPSDPRNSEWEDEYSISLDPFSGHSNQIVAALKESLDDRLVSYADCSAKIYWEYERKGYPQHGPIHKSISSYQNPISDSAVLTVSVRVPMAYIDMCSEFNELARVSILDLARRDEVAIQAAKDAKEKQIEVLKEQIRKLEES